MAYKLLYIEDLDPGSIISDLKDNGFEMMHLNPGSFENLIDQISKSKFDAVILDFRLNQGSENAIFDAPTIAQMLRTKSANQSEHFPIFLISTESKISSFYEDFTSNDLFDLSIPKELFQKNLSKYCKRISDFIECYVRISEQKFQMPAILGINKEKYSELDYRFSEKKLDEYSMRNTYKISRFIHNTVIRSIGLLIGEDVLSARLGVNKLSKGWADLLNAFSEAKYTGIFSNTYNRWWPNEIEKICLEKYKISNLRRIKSKERISAFLKAGVIGLEAPEKLKFSDSSNFWTICKEFLYPIDPIDGLELIQNEAIPWQDKEYISILAAMETSKYLKFVKPSELARFQEILTELKHG